MKYYLLLILYITGCFSVFSQIGINTETPEATSVLGIHAFSSSTSLNQGVLLPTMTTSQKMGIATPATGLLVYDTDQNCTSQNLGTEIAPKWSCLMLFNTQFFYMPSINIDTSTTGQKTLDLYKEYKRRFDGSSASFQRSAGSPLGFLFSKGYLLLCNALQ